MTLFINDATTFNNLFSMFLQYMLKRKQSFQKLPEKCEVIYGGPLSHLLARSY